MGHVIAKLIAVAVVVHVNVVAHSVAVARESEESTVAGCVKTGSKEGEFVLVVDDKLTYQIEGAEGLDLAQHANHRVELTGTIEKSETGAIVKAKALKMVSTSCEA